MNEEKVSGRPQVLLSTACLIIIIGGLKIGRPILVPFMVATFLAIITAPIVRFLKKNGLSRGMAILMVVGLVLGLLSSFVWFLGDSADQFAKVMPQHLERVSDDFTVWLSDHGFTKNSPDLSKSFQAPMIAVVTSIAAGLAKAVSNLLVITILLSFMLLEADSLPRKLEVAFGVENNTMSKIREFELDLQRYLVVKTLISLATGISVAIMCRAIGLDFALLLGVIAFLLNFIPNIGSIIASIPAVIIAGVTMGLGAASLVGGGFFAVNMLLGTILEPQIMGQKLGLPPIVVVTSLVFWGWVWGPAGMILSVPLTMAIKIYSEHTQNYQWAGVLLGLEPIGAKLPPVVENA
jgi:predicted PurR-regulated permease PerM